MSSAAAAKGDIEAAVHSQTHLEPIDVIFVDYDLVSLLGTKLIVDDNKHQYLHGLKSYKDLYPAKANEIDNNASLEETRALARIRMELDNIKAVNVLLVAASKKERKSEAEDGVKLAIAGDAGRDAVFYAASCMARLEQLPSPEAVDALLRQYDATDPLVKDHAEYLTLKRVASIEKLVKLLAIFIAAEKRVIELNEKEILKLEVDLVVSEARRGEDERLVTEHEESEKGRMQYLKPFVHALKCLEEVKLSVLLPLKMEHFEPVLRKMSIDFAGLSKHDVRSHFKDSEFMYREDHGGKNDDSNIVFGKSWGASERGAARESYGLRAGVEQWDSFMRPKNWLAKNAYWYTPRFKRLIYDLYMQGWIRSEKDDDTTFVESRLKLANWQRTVQKNTYYNDFVWWVLWPWRRFESRQSPFMYVLPAAQLA